MAEEKQTLKDRLKGQPPFADEPEEEKEKPIEPAEADEQVEEEKVVAEPKVEGAEDTAEPKTTEEEKELPEEAKQRTKEQFEKLKESNKRLKQENEKIRDEARKYAKDGLVSTLVPDAPTPPPPQQQQPQYDWDRMLTNQVPPAAIYPNLSKKQVKNVFDDLVDDQGYVNTDLLKETLADANNKVFEAQQEAIRLRQEINSARRSMDDFQRSQIAKQVHEKYPQLNPETEEFDSDFFEATRDKMIANLAKGLPEDFMGAADALSRRYIVKKEEKKNVEKQQNAIAQINATGTKGMSGRRSYGDHEALVKAVRAGKKGALAERLKRAGY